MDKVQVKHTKEVEEEGGRIIKSGYQTPSGQVAALGWVTAFKKRSRLVSGLKFVYFCLLIKSVLATLCLTGCPMRKLDRQLAPTKPDLLQTQWQREAGFLAEKQLCVQFHSIILLAAVIRVLRFTILAAGQSHSCLLFSLLLSLPFANVSKALEIRGMRAGEWQLWADWSMIYAWTLKLLQWWTSSVVQTLLAWLFKLES